MYIIRSYFVVLWNIRNYSSYFIATILLFLFLFFPTSSITLLTPSEVLLTGFYSLPWNQHSQLPQTSAYLCMPGLRHLTQHSLDSPMLRQVRNFHTNNKKETESVINSQWRNTQKETTLLLNSIKLLENYY